MTIPRDSLRWNGWGRLGDSVGLSRARETALLEELGRRLGRTIERGSEPVALDDVSLPPVRIPENVLTRLRAACGDDGVRVGQFERVAHAVGRSLPDLLRLRRGELAAAPDAVVYPADEGAVAAVLRVAADADLAVIPFGGGSSVVGGVEPRPDDRHRGVLCLDTTRLEAVVRVDATSRTATVQAGIYGPPLEAELRRQGFSLGHFPQSFEQSTVGGWIAARSTGQLSSHYGGIDELLVAVRVVTPQGVLRTLEVPRSAAGPDLNHLVLGSEGTLGVIVEATLRISPAPRVEDDRGMLFRSFADGVAAVREASGAGLGIALARLSDAAETSLYEALRRDPARGFDPGALALAGAQRLGYGASRCALIYGAEGPDASEVRHALARMRALGRAHGGLPLGRGPGRAWRRDRFRAPLLRDWLLDHDVASDTFETSFPWSRLERGHDGILRAVQAALEAHAGSGLVMAHLSHSYSDGGCLYFSMIYPLDGARPVKQWSEIKRLATDAVVAEGGTVSHHHGVGIDHAPWLPAEKGALGMAALHAVKASADPKGLMNPGKLL